MKSKPISKIEFLPGFLSETNRQFLKDYYERFYPSKYSEVIPPESKIPRFDPDLKVRSDLYLPEHIGKPYNDRLMKQMSWKKTWINAGRTTIKTEGMRIGSYDSTQLGYGRHGHFAPHRDNDGPLTKARIAGFVAAINDPSEYEGGDLVFPELGVTTRLPQGTAIVFDADILHGVTPVTSGSRLVLISFAYL